MDTDVAQAAAQVLLAAPGAPEVDLSPGGTGIPPEVLDRLPPPPVADPADDGSVGIVSATWHSQVPTVSIMHVKFNVFIWKLCLTCLRDEYCPKRWNFLFQVYLWLSKEVLNGYTKTHLNFWLV